MRKLATVIAIVGAATAMAVALAAVPKVAQANPACGATLTTDTTLDANLTCTTTPGLIIGANGITVDLNGFTLSSGGVFCGFCHGIRNGDFSATANPSPTFGFDNVTITNGTIVGFEQGIRGDTVSGFTIENVTLTGQTSSNVIDILESDDVVIELVSISLAGPGAPEAIRLENVDGVVVENVDVDGGAVGVNFGCDPCDTGEHTDGVIENSTFTNNGNGIFLAATEDARVEGNTVTNSASTAVLVGLKCFVGIFPEVSGVEISGNDVSNNSSSGITLCTAVDSEVFGNIASDNGGAGIRLLGDSIDNDIKENVATGNTGFDMSHDGTSTPNEWEGNTCGTRSGADIDC